MSLEIDTQEIKDALVNSIDWRTAVTDLVRFWINEGRSFSSGEVAAAIRIHRPELQFRVGSVGEMLRDQFHSQNLDLYPDDGYGSPTYPYQGLRIAQGLYPTRTSAGTEVFVYGPSQDAIDEHPFEVYIPIPGEAVADYPDPDSQAASVPAPTVSMVISGRLAKSDIKAKVWNDGRMMVPRAALEAAVYLGGTPMHGGDNVFVSQTPNEVVILTTDPNSTEFKAYEVWSSGGRVVFPSIDKNVLFTAGEQYTCQVEDGKITIDLNPDC